jgi:hypothetical protein
MVGGAAQGGNHANHDSEATTVEPIFYLPTRGQVNYQSILREQGVRFSDGVLPRNNILDIPMTAWHEMVSDSSSNTAETLQIIIGDADVAESSAQGAARAMHTANTFTGNDDQIPPTFMMARTIFLNLQLPSMYIGAKSLSSAIFPPFSLIKTVFSSKASTHADEDSIKGRRVARKLCFDDSPSSDDLLLADVSMPEQLNTEERRKKPTGVVKPARSARKNEVQITTAVRRSPRNNIYNGFKVDTPSDVRKRKSKVLCRVTPSVSSTPFTASPGAAAMKDDVPPVPPPTPIPILQKIGVKICAIPPEDLTEDKLQKQDSEDEA